MPPFSLQRYNTLGAKWELMRINFLISLIISDINFPSLFYTCLHRGMQFCDMWQCDNEKSAPWSVSALIVGVCIHPFKKSKGKTVTLWKVVLSYTEISWLIIIKIFNHFKLWVDKNSVAPPLSSQQFQYKVNLCGWKVNKIRLKSTFVGKEATKPGKATTILVEKVNLSSTDKNHRF